MGALTAVTLAGLASAVVLAVIGGLPFDLPMPTQRYGWVEPTCGLTRGSTALAGGDLTRAWSYNPASYLVVAFGLFGASRAAWGWLTGRWLTLRLRPSRLGWVLIGVAVVALWAHQQSNADFVIHARG